MGKLMNIPPNTSDKQSLFKDHFSHNSDAYSKHRPTYPDELFSYLSSITKNHKLAWDCATGSGQAATCLTPYFKQVIASDASTEQIANTTQHDAVRYTVCSAENSGIISNSLDIITVAQALHWFNIPAFTAEVNRTLKQDGILAVWTYNLLHIRTDIDEQLHHLYNDVLESYWPAERHLVEQGYKTIDFPYPELSTPDFQMILNWDCTQLIAYLTTWSAVKSYIREKKNNPIKLIEKELLALWGNADIVKTVTWPLTVRAWRKP
jgi:ubiquinone/menaquinone biosynthesis C-methylase UbiE